MNQASALYLREARRWAKLRKELYDDICNFPDPAPDCLEWWLRSVAQYTRRIERFKADFLLEREGRKESR